MTKPYNLTIQVTVRRGRNSTVADNPESIAEAVRFYLRRVLAGARQPGMLYSPDTIHVEAQEQSP
jgi:hypothetical protein